MARRKKKGSGRKILAGLIALIVIGVIGYSFFVEPINLAQITSLITFEDPFTAITGNEDFWSIPSSFYFALGDFDGVHCWIALTLTQFNDDGTSELLASNSGVTVELLEITGGFSTSAKPVNLVKVSPRISCQDTTSTKHDIRLAGGTIKLESFVRDKVTGSVIRVDSKFATIPALNRDLKVENGRGNILLPSLTSSADVIESFIMVPDTVASRNIDVIFRTSSYASITIDGTTVKAGNLEAGLGGLLKFINPDFGASLPPTVKGTQVTMTSINPLTHYYISNSGEVPTGATGSSIVTLNDEIRATFKGTEDNWSGSEGIPTLTIKDPRGVTRASGIPMTTIKTLSGGITEFSRIGVSIPFMITDNNIDFVKGTWKAEMHQAGRTAIGVKTFVLLDSRPEVVAPCPTGTVKEGTECVTQTPTCVLPKVLINGVCKIDEEPIPTSCPDPTELQLTIVGLSNTELLEAFGLLELNSAFAPLDTCDQQALILITAELNKRGLSTTTPPIPIGSIGTAFIRYSSSLTDPTGGGGGGGCPLTGQVPTTALPIVGLQLLGLGSCDGLRFGSVELTPSLDFGDNVKNIQIDASSIRLQQDLFLAKNNPYPAKPVVECSTPTTSNIGICNITNHAFISDGTGSIQIAPKEVTFVRNFVDKDTRGDYEIVKVVLRESAIIDKIQSNGLALADGDEVSLLYLIWGTFSGTNSGSQFIASIPAMTFVQSFTFSTGISGVTCDAPSQRVVFPNPEDPDAGDVRIASGSETGQCLPCAEVESLGLVSSCPVEMCPAGTEGVVPNCQVIITCNLPNRIIDGVCRPPLDATCPNAGDVRDPVTNVCRAPKMCNVDPICTATEKFAVTNNLDDCGGNILICVPKTTVTTKEPCPNPDTQFRDSLGKCVTLRTNDCPNEGEARNSLGICEKTGVLDCPVGFSGIVPNCVPDGNNPNPINFCQLGAEGFNLSQCLASIFGSGGGEGLMITGIDQTVLIVIVMIAILIIVIAVIIRKRRGGGFNP